MTVRKLINQLTYCNMDANISIEIINNTPYEDILIKGGEIQNVRDLDVEQSIYDRSICKICATLRADS